MTTTRPDDPPRRPRDRADDHGRAGRSRAFAHSHGGNIALYALRNRDVAAAVAGLVTLATPFIVITARPLERPLRIVTAILGLFTYVNAMWPIINGALGVKRYRVTFTGPGGHSFNAFGLVDPGLAMAGAMARLGRLSVPEAPKTTFNVGVVGGGTSVNSIPVEMYMDVDLRSESPSELTRLEDALRVFVREAIDEEGHRRS